MTVCPLTHCGCLVTYTLRLGKTGLQLMLDRRSSLTHTTRSSATQRNRATRYVSWNLVNCCTTVQNIALERLAVGNLHEGDSRSSELPLFDKSLYHLLLVVCSNNDSVWQWHRLRDITTFAVYTTGCDLEKSFVCEKIVEITSHMRFPFHRPHLISLPLWLCVYLHRLRDIVTYFPTFKEATWLNTSFRG